MSSKGNTMYLKFSNYKNEFRSEIQHNYRKSSLLFCVFRSATADF